MFLEARTQNIRSGSSPLSLDFASVWCSRPCAGCRHSRLPSALAGSRSDMLWWFMWPLLLQFYLFCLACARRSACARWQGVSPVQSMWQVLLALRPAWMLEPTLELEPGIMRTHTHVSLGVS
eukprot:2361394-Amphidinium_carterae.1